MSKLVTISQTVSQQVHATFDKELLKAISKVSSHAQLSNEANWSMVSFIYKHTTSSKRITLSFKGNFSKTAKAKVKAGMLTGDNFELKKVIICGPNRVPLLSLERADVSNPSELDFVLGSSGSESSPATVSLTTDAAAGVNGFFTVTATFNKAVTTFTSDTQITVTNGFASEPYFVNSSTYEIQITPNGNSSGELVSVSIAQNALSEGNSASNTLTRTYYDLVGVTLVPSESGVISGPITVNATFNRPVTGFTLSDIEVEINSGNNGNPVYGGTVSNLSGSGANYTFTFTPISLGNSYFSFFVNIHTVLDGNGVGNSASNFVTGEYYGQKTLTLSKVGLGTAAAYDAVSSGLLVSADGSYNSYEYNKAISLQAASNLNNYFVGWSGDISSTTNPQGLSLISDKSITATFAESFNKVGGLIESSVVHAAARQSDGKLIIGGTFTSYANFSCGRIVRLNVDGTVDTTFNAGSGFNTGAVNSIAVDSSGNIWVGGTFTSFNGVANSANRFAKLSSTGELLKINASDTNSSTGNGFSGTGVYIIKFDSSGYVWVGGDFTSYKGTANNARYISKLNPNTGEIVKINAADTNAVGGNGFENIVYDIEFDSSSNIWVGGAFTQYKSTANSANRIAKLNSNGELLKVNASDTDTSSGNGFGGIVRKIKLDSSSNVWLGGAFTSYKGVANSANRIAKLNSSGELQKINAADANSATGNGFNNDVYDIEFDSTGNIWAGGTFTSYKSATANVSRRIALLSSSGALLKIHNDDAVVTNGVDNNVNKILRVTDNHLMLFGAFISFYEGLSQKNAFGFVSLKKTDGVSFKMDHDFNSFQTTLYGFRFSYLSSIEGIVNDSLNRKIIFGSFELSNDSSYSAKNIARLNSDGTLDTTFNVGSGFNSFVNDVKIDSSGNIWVGGGFTSYKGITNSANRIAKLNSSGDLLKINAADTNTATGNGFDNYVNVINFDSSGNIWAGGGFTQYKSTANSARFIAKLNSSGELQKINAADTNSTTGNGFGNTINSIQFDSMGNIWVGGTFTSYKGVTNSANRIAKLSSVGELLKINAADTNSSTGNGFNNDVFVIKIDSSDNVWVGGNMTSYKGVATNANYIAKLNSNGELQKINAADTNTNSGNGFNGRVQVIEFDVNGNIWIGGNFTQYKTTANNANRIAKLNSTGTLIAINSSDTSSTTGNGFGNAMVKRILFDSNDVYIGLSYATSTSVAAKNMQLLAPIVKLYDGSKLNVY